ncbi:MAG TPA: sterol desaturase family protein [Bdellovibrionales bacterium]|nr:sterol desaturase family protein [Bdellovibrionales bacterium]
MTKALLPNLIVLAAFWLLTLYSLRADRGLVAARTRREWILDLCGLAVQGVLVPLIQVWVLFQVLDWAVPALRSSLALPGIAAFLLNFVLVDYAYYWNHRLLHLPRFWPAHAVHHSIESLDPVATSRNTLWSPVLIVYLWLNGLGLYLLKDPFWFLMGAAATASLDLWRHTFALARPAESRVGRMLSAVLITPVEHAWHHSTTHTDTNFGANFNFWDRLHGTFARRGDVPSKLGFPTGMSFRDELLTPYRRHQTSSSGAAAAGAARAKKRVSYLGRALAFFPLFTILVTLFCAYMSVVQLSWFFAAAAFCVLYVLPPLAYRLHNRFYPLKTGMTRLSGGDYSPWWGGHQIQLLYIAVPSLEALLRVIPGVYSAWLRLWGSRVGRGVYWTPQVEITDRALLEIGDHVVFGHKAAFYNHVVNPKKDKMFLYVNVTKIGSGVFVGAGSRVGPGAVIESGVQLPILTDVHINQRITAEMEFDPREKTNGLKASSSMAAQTGPAPQPMAAAQPEPEARPEASADPLIEWETEPADHALLEETCIVEHAKALLEPATLGTTSTYGRFTIRQPTRQQSHRPQVLGPRPAADEAPAAPILKRPLFKLNLEE